MELNDPFEFLAADLSNKRLRQSLQEAKIELSKSKGIICFSRNWQNPVQWSHYADHHKGICLAFDVPAEFVEEVQYLKERIVSPTIIDFDTMKKFLTTKFEHWAYEEEYRSFIGLDPELEENGLYFFDFSENLKLKSVMVGSRCTLTRKQLATALGDMASQVEVWKTRPAFKKFAVVRNENESLWV